MGRSVAWKNIQNGVVKPGLVLKWIGRASVEVGAGLREFGAADSCVRHYIVLVTIDMHRLTLRMLILYN